MWKINTTSIKLIQGDITDCEVDAIVNAANTDLLLGAGVAGAIRKKGGPTIQQECSKIGPVELGQAVITTAGNLIAKHVIHAASMVLGGRTTGDSLRKSVLNSLHVGIKNEIHSIAFPAIGTGIAGFPLDKCAEIMFECFQDFINQNETNYEMIEVVLFSRDDFQIFHKKFEYLFSELQ